MIAENAGVESGHDVKAGLRVGAVTDDIAQADDLLAFLLLDISQHALQGFQVAVNVT